MGQATFVSLGAGPVFDISGQRPELRDFTIDGNLTVSDGVLLQDKGGIRGRFIRLEVLGVTGDPGIGFANTNRSHSLRIDLCVIHNNTIGVKLVKRYHATTINGCVIFHNSTSQIELGDGTGTTRMVVIRDTQVENAFEQRGLVVNRVDPLTLDGVYFESSGGPSTDIEVEGSSRIRIDGMYAQGNSSANHSIVLNSDVNLSIKNSFFAGYKESIPDTAAPGRQLLLENTEIRDGHSTSVRQRISALQVTGKHGDNQIYVSATDPDNHAFIKSQNASETVSGIFGVSRNIPELGGPLPADSVVVGSVTDSPLILSTKYAERVRIDSSGNVGIGTESPQSALQIRGYTQIDLTSGPPPSADCDDDSERGRMKLDGAARAELIYICVDSGWISK